MFNTIEHYDIAVLMSGDGDFERALTLLRAIGKQCRVMATDRFIARELLNVTGRHYIRLDSMRKEIEKKLQTNNSIC